MIGVCQRHYTPTLEAVRHDPTLWAGTVHLSLVWHLKWRAIRLCNSTLLQFRKVVYRAVSWLFSHTTAKETKVTCSSVWQTLDLGAYSSEVSCYSCIVSEVQNVHVRSNHKISSQARRLHRFDCIKLKRKHSPWCLINCYIKDICRTTSYLAIFRFHTAFLLKPWRESEQCQLHGT